MEAVYCSYTKVRGSAAACACAVALQCHRREPGVYSSNTPHSSVRIVNLWTSVQATIVQELAETVACEAVCNDDTCLALLPVAIDCCCSRLTAQALQVRLEWLLLHAVSVF